MQVAPLALPMSGRGAEAWAAAPSESLRLNTLPVTGSDPRQAAASCSEGMLKRPLRLWTGPNRHYPLPLFHFYLELRRPYELLLPTLRALKRCRPRSSPILLPPHRDPPLGSLWGLTCPPSLLGASLARDRRRAPVRPVCSRA